MAFAKIDYGCGTAQFWGPFTEETVKRDFYAHANECFGIRKSIMGFDLLEFSSDAMPDPWAKFPDADYLLKHSGDTILWGKDGEKIKSEWD